MSLCSYVRIPYISKCLTSSTSSFLTRDLNISVVYLGVARSASHNALHSSSYTTSAQLRTCNSVVVVISSKLKMNGVGTPVMPTGS